MTRPVVVGTTAMVLAVIAAPDALVGADRPPAFDALAERVAALAVELGRDAGSEPRAYAEGLDADPAPLLAIEERLEAGTGSNAARRQRRVGAGPPGAAARRSPGRRDRAPRPPARLPRRAPGRARRATERRPCRRSPAAGRAGRRRAGEALDGRSATLEVVLEPHPDEYGAAGRDGRAAGRPEPRNRGGAAAKRRPRGGLSRVMLALSGLGQAATAGRWSSTRSTPGSAARRRGSWRGLRALGAEQQVICITHLPQVASPRRRPLPAGEGRRRRAGAGPGREARTARPWSPRSAACLAAAGE